MMPSNTNRRRFIQLAGTGTALSIAGCNSLQSDGTGTGDGTDGQTSGSATVTLQIQLGQEAQQQLQQQQRQIQSQIRSGELTQAAGRSRIREAQTEVYGEAITSFQSVAQDDAALTVENSVAAFGVLLVSGTPEALIDSLTMESVGSLFAESTFQRAQSQAQQGTQAPADGTTETPSGS